MLAASFPFFSVREQRHSLPAAEEWTPLFGLTIFNPGKQSAGDPGPGGGGFLNSFTRSVQSSEPCTQYFTKCCDTETG